jgi:hypothetical protein
MIPDDVVEEVLLRCGPAATGVYLYLERRANKDGQCWPSMTTIATACGVSQRYVRELINEKLVPSGMVRRTEKKNQFGRTMGVEYTLPFHHNPRNNGAEPTPEPGEELTPEPESHIGSAKVDTRSSKEVKNSSPSLTDEQRARFNRWYATYPRKVKRADAESAWAKINPDDALTDRMVSVVGIWATSKDWTKENGQFVPYPASWLNGRRWEDDPPQAAKKQAERKIRYFG